MVHVTVSNRNYAFGMAQPAILAVRKDESVLEKWAIVPSVVCLYCLLSISFEWEQRGKVWLTCWNR
jgi:hypothetical protein